MDERGLVETITSEARSPPNVVVERVVAIKKEKVNRRIAQAIDREWIRPMERQDLSEGPETTERGVVKSSAAVAIALVDRAVAGGQKHTQCPFVISKHGGVKEVVKGFHQRLRI